MRVLVKRTFRLFARIASVRGVPVIIDRLVTADGSLGELRVRYGEKIQTGRVSYPVRRNIGSVVAHYLSDLDTGGKPFRS